MLSSNLVLVFRIVLVAILLLTVLGTYIELPGAHAQGPDDYVDDVARFLTSTTRRTRGQRGEINVVSPLRKLGYEIEERYPKHRVLDQGIDAIYRDLKTMRFNIVEAKATSEQGKLYRSLLPVRKGGEHQMDDVWIRKKLKEAAVQAREIFDDPTIDLTTRNKSRHTLELIDEIAKRRYGQSEKTLVITRLLGVDPDLHPSERIASDVLAEFTHVIEVARNGRVLWVHK